MPINLLADEMPERKNKKSPINLLADEMPSQKESFGESLAMSPFRVIKDVGNAGISALQSVPSYIEKGRTEIPGLWNLLMENPGAAGKQFGAGLAEAGQNAFNLPHDVANYYANRLNLLPKNINERIQMGRMPEDTQDMINQIFGEVQEPGEALARGGGRHVNLLGTAVKGIANTPALFRTKKYFSKELIKAHDALEQSAIKGFEKVSDEVSKRKLPHFNVDPYAIEDLREYFPKTKQFSELIDKAKIGDYESLRRLQTNLYEKGKKNINSSLDADRMRGYEMFEKRNDINSLISDNLKQMGQEDLSTLLDKSRQQWGTLQNTYYDPDLSSSLRKMFDSDVRKMPKDVTELLSQESKPMDRLWAAHPSLKEKLANYSMRNNLLKAGGYGLGTGLASALYNMLKKGHKE